MKLPIDKYGKVSISIEEEPWSASKNYDKLTILEAGEGTFKTYISRIPTPAGTPLSNRHYWIPFSKLDNNIVIDYNEFKASVTEELVQIKEYLERYYRRINYILKDVPANRGEYEDGEHYYKGNLVQYRGSTFIADPEDYDIDTKPLAFIDWPPYDNNISNLNPGWHIFAKGGDTVDVVTDINWDSQNKKLVKTINGENFDIITAQELKQEIGVNIHYIPQQETLVIN